MQIALSGRDKFKRIPTYGISGWRNVRNDETGVTYRPGWGVLLNRLVGTLLASVLIAGLYGAYNELGAPGLRRTPQQNAEIQRQLREAQARLEEMKEDTRKLMSEEEWRELETQMAADQARRQAKAHAQKRRIGQVQRVVQGGCLALMGVLAFFGILAPLSCLWGRVAVEKDVRGDLVVRKWGLLWPSSRSWPVTAFKGMNLVANEVMVGRRGLRRSIGWRWRVRLVPADATNQPEQMRAALGLTEYGVDFWVHQQKDQPIGRPPAPVMDFVRALHRITGLVCSKPVVTAYQATGPARGTQHVVSQGGPAVTTHTSHSSDDVPEHLRPEVQKMMANAGAAGAPQSGTWKTTRTYHSLEEVPEHLRPRIEKMMAEAHEQGAPQSQVWQTSKKTITVRDAQGNVRTYHSVDEMPPDVREAYERARNARP